MEIEWRNIFLYLTSHYIALEALYYILIVKTHWQTILWFFLLKYASLLGLTAGAHRLWSHRSYKAKLPLRILLCVFQTIAFQKTIFSWVRDHRVHHKYSDTDADPHNASRGFFFAHIGWTMVRKHPDVIAKGRMIDLSDLYEDPVVCFQYKYYAPLTAILVFMVPTLVPWYFWNEDVYVAFAVAVMLKFTLTMHYIFLINSAAHMFGYKPYDKSIKPSENVLVSYLTQGEGWHNYHHSFPWDYKAAELDSYHGNLATAFIDFMVKIGWAYDLKVTTKEMIDKRMIRSGTVNHGTETF